LAGWLKNYAEKHHDFDQALDLSIKLFWMRPSIEAYAEVRRLTEPLGRWAELRAGMLGRLEEKGSWALLTEIYLEEGQIDFALKALEKARVASRWGEPESLVLQVAEAACQARRQESIQLFLSIARCRISMRDRSNYAQAAVYLKQIQGIYRRLGDLQTWQKLIGNLREENRSLRALQDELNRAQL
jgi:hypothetical protein